MEHTTYASRLRYLDADDVHDAVVDYDGMDVRGPDGDALGSVDGFIVDAQAGRVYYVVVDSGGWFSSRRMLLPIGHTSLDAGSKFLNVDVSKGALMRYPEFDEDRFRAFSDEDLRMFESRMVEACCPDDAVSTTAAGGSSVRTWAYDTRRHYGQPSWWAATYAAERLRPVESPATRAMASHPPIIDRSARVGDQPQAERITAREGVQADDVSPHLDGRAQPGDVLGIETGGERTYIGESAEDENKRRRDAERAAEDDRPPRQSDR